MRPSPRSALLAAILALPAFAQPEVPPWAEDWAYIWLDARDHGSLRLQARLTAGTLPADRNAEQFALLEVTSVNFPQDERPPVNAAIVLDRSASMKGNRIRVVRKAATDLISVLGPRDQLAIVLVNDDVEVSESMRATEQNKQAMIRFITEAPPEGGSDLSAGMAEGYDQVLQHKGGYDFHRVVVVSDGHPNKGMADPDGLADIARKVREAESIHTSTFTIGRGSDAELMHGIAREGWGFTGDLQDASHVFRVGRRIEVDLLRRAAEKAVLEVKLAPEVTLVDVLERAAEVRGSTLLIPLHEFAHDETARVVLRLAVRTGAAGTRLRLLDATLRYHDALVDREADASTQLWAQVSGDANAVAQGIDARALLVAAQAVTARALAQAQDRFDSGYAQEARELLSSTRAFLDATTEASGIVTADELDAVQKLEARLFPAREKARPSRAPKKKKGRR